MGDQAGTGDGLVRAGCWPGRSFWWRGGSFLRITRDNIRFFYVPDT